MSIELKFVRRDKINEREINTWIDRHCFLLSYGFNEILSWKIFSERHSDVLWYTAEKQEGLSIIVHEIIYADVDALKTKWISWRFSFFNDFLCWS